MQDNSDFSVVSLPAAGGYNTSPDTTAQSASEPKEEYLIADPQVDFFDDPVPLWVKYPGPDVSADDAETMQEIIIEKWGILSNRNANAPNEAFQQLMDVLGALPNAGDPPDDVPSGEVLQQENMRLNEIDHELQALIDRNHIIANAKAIGVPRTH